MPVGRKGKVEMGMSLYVYDLINQASNRDAESQQKLGDCYFYGEENVSVDYDLAFSLYSKAAKQKNAVSQFMLSCC